MAPTEGTGASDKEASSTAATPEHEHHHHHTSLKEYASCLCNKVYLSIWLAECVKQFGNWFTFVGCYSLITKLTHDTGVPIALYLLSRRVPYLLFFMLGGLLADRLNRGWLLVACCLLMGAVSFCLPLIQERSQLPLLYGLILAQWSAQTAYDPSRTAAVPTVVHSRLICAAASLDLMAFSLMAIIGATLAGVIATRHGAAACFRVEGCAFAVAALLYTRLIGHQRKMRQAKADALHEPLLEQAQHDHAGREADSRPPLLLSRAAEQQQASSSAPRPQPCTVIRPADADAEAGAGAAAEAHALDDEQVSSGADSDEKEQETLLGAAAATHAPRGTSCFDLSGLFGGFAYLCQARNIDVALLIFAKATGALVWGPADVLNAKFAGMPSMQGLGSESATLGYILACVGVGSIIGPLGANALVPGRARWWRVSVACAFGLLTLGYLLFVLARDVRMVLLGTVVRTTGSCTLWVHSLSVLQHRLGDDVRGRVLAIEFVLYTTSEAASTLGAGWAVDALQADAPRLAGACALLGTFFMALWGLHAWVFWHNEERLARIGLISAPSAASPRGGAGGSGSAGAGTSSGAP